MKKQMIFVLAGVVLVVVLGAWWIVKGEEWVVKSDTAKVTVSGEIKRLADQLGWGGSKSVRLLDGKVVPRWLFRKIDVEYTDQVQPYFTQQAGKGEPVFASVNTIMGLGRLKILIFVDRNRLVAAKDAHDRQWLVAHQLIRVVNFMVNRNLSGDQLMKKDGETFRQFSEKDYFNVTVL